ncbi:MAG: peptidase T [Alkalispirochaeta sp.]
MSSHQYRQPLATDVQDRFLRYVRVHTTSDRHGSETPSSPRQFDLAHMLAGELEAMGVADVQVTDYCYVIARIPASTGVDSPPLALLAHMDTAPDSSGENVDPQVWESYDGSVLKIGHGLELDPREYPDLLEFVGETIITADGSTLLGADDKAGVAEIMAVAQLLVTASEIRHPEIEIIFTPDEEIGRGVDKLPLSELHSRFGYTLDGGKEGSIEAECFSAYAVTVEIEGYVIHPGSARGKMVNAVALAGRFLSMIPQTESPETTDHRDGFYCPVEIRGDYGKATIDFIIRDFDLAEVKRRMAMLEQLGVALERAYPRSTVTVTSRKQYLNMRDEIEKYPFVLDLLTRAVEFTGVAPVLEPIRGGTDGARLTEMGMPTPNIFAGGLNFHGPYEWIPVRAMVRAAETIINLIQLWSEEVPADTQLPKLHPENR